MRYLLRAALPFALLLSSAVSAIEIEVGGRSVEVPIPEGYAELTPEMSPTYEAMYAYVLPSNERHLILIPREDAEAILRGKDVAIGRYMMVESERQSSRFDFTQGDFDELRDTMRGQIEEMWESARQGLPEVFDDVSESMSEALDADIEMSVGEIISMEMHLDTDDLFAFSQIISIGVALEGEDLGSDRMMATVAVTRARSKLIFLMVYGYEDDLKWTREHAAVWANQILAVNPALTGPALSPDGSNDDGLQPTTDSASDREPSEGYMLGPASKAIIVALAFLAAFFVLRRLRRQREK